MTTRKTIQELKIAFETGRIPNGQDYADFIDATFNYIDEQFLVRSVNGKTPVNGDVETDYRIIDTIPPDVDWTDYPEGASEFYTNYDPDDYVQYITDNPSFAILPKGDIAIRTFINHADNVAYQQVDNVKDGVFNGAFVRVGLPSGVWGDLVKKEGNGNNVVGYETKYYYYNPAQGTGAVTNFTMQIPGLDMERDILFPTINGRGNVGKDYIIYDYNDPYLEVTLKGGWSTTSAYRFEMIVFKQIPQTLMPVPTATDTVKGVVKVDGTTVTIDADGVISATGATGVVIQGESRPIKMWTGTTTTGTDGLWSVDYTSGGFTSIRSIQITLESSISAAADKPLGAYVVSKSATGASGKAYKASSADLLDAMQQVAAEPGTIVNIMVIGH